jgi:aspartate aminotransferase
VVRLVDELLPELSYVTPRGAFYVFLRVDGAFQGEITDGSAFCSWLLTEAGVALVPGAAFGDDRYARLSYATSDEVLEDAIRRVAAAMRAR